MLYQTHVQSFSNYQIKIPEDKTFLERKKSSRERERERFTEKAVGFGVC